MESELTEMGLTLGNTGKVEKDWRDVRRWLKPYYCVFPSKTPGRKDKIKVL